MTRILLATAGVLAPGVAIAHPDHLHGGDYGLVHLFTDPFHLALAAGATLLAVASWRLLRRRQAAERRRR
jgi:hypothetical protein